MEHQKQPQPKHPGGRPKKKISDEIDLELVERAGKLGLTDTELGTLFGKSERTINRWKKNKQFLSALKKGKLGADNEVVESLFKRAKGYEFTERTVEMVNNEKGEPKVKSIKEVKKHIPADVLASTVWLNNRRSQSWRRNGQAETGINAEQWDKLLAAAHASMVHLAGAGTATSGN